MILQYIFAKFFKKIHFPAVKNSIISSKGKICSGAHVVNTKMGKHSYIGNFTTVLDTDIGNYCSIADNCVIGGRAHPIDWITTSPVSYGKKNCLRENFTNLDFDESSHTYIDSDVWIGDKCLIKAGIHLSTGCVIGMGSVVTKDVGPYEIWAGNPARFIRKRFDDKTIVNLLKTQWWNWEDEKIKKYAQYFNQPEEFIRAVQKRENE